MKIKVKSFLLGMASILEIMPQRKVQERYRLVSDEEALRQDWNAIGHDLQTAMDIVHSKAMLK